MKSIPLMQLLSKRRPFRGLSESQKAMYFAKIRQGLDTECWPWLGAKNVRGYGHMTINQASISSTRIGWYIANESDAYPLYVLHSCDNPSCQNPKHWFLGNDQDNADDKARKFRGARKLDFKSVLLIKRAIRANIGTNKQLGHAFGVGSSIINDIKHETRWKYVPWPD